MKLTGRAVSDVTDQSLVFLEMKKRTYSKELFGIYGLNDYFSKYPQALECADTCSEISGGAAALLNLSERVAVTNGPMDVAACALGAGVVDSGDCCSIIGTAALHEMVIDMPCGDNVFAGMTVCHAMGDKWLRLMASLAGTPNVEWIFRLFGEELRSRVKGREVYAYAEELISGVPIGANGIIYHPYLLAGGERAPFFAPAARASFTGISVNHGVGDVIRACYEGVAFAMMDCYANMPGVVRRVTLCGGGAKSPLWAQMFADAVGRDVATVQGEELGAKGCFIANAYAQGIFGSYEEGVEKTVKPGKTYASIPANHEKYTKYYQLYKQTCAALFETWKLRQQILFEG